MNTYFLLFKTITIIYDRTFLESEVENAKARSDLYEKMIKVDPSAPTAEELETKAITKLRYMQVRCSSSFVSSLKLNQD